MGVKITFYISGTDEKYKNNYTIEAGKVCSEFIARYFRKTQEVPTILKDKIINENYLKYDYESAISDVQKGIYKVNIDKMEEDEQGTFEFKTFKECKNVRNKILEIDKSKAPIYAFLTI